MRISATLGRRVAATLLLATLLLAAFGRGLHAAWPLASLFSSKPKGVTMSTIPDARRIEHSQTETFADDVLRSDVPVLVDFYADWCGPCRALTPVLEEVARETPHARVVKINVDESPELAARYRVSSIPCLVMFRDGRAVGKHAGLADKATLKRILAR
jgi:thioredoxin 1